MFFDLIKIVALW